METTEKIVEAYVRYVKGWATIPNIRCKGQYEIDLLAIDPATLKRYHIETSVSGSQAYAKLTAKEFDPALLKVRIQKSKMRRTLGYFIEHKFGNRAVRAKLREYGFKPGAHKQIVVTWGWTPEAETAAEEASVELWDFRKIMREIAHSIHDKRTYFSDDTLRTLNLFVRALDNVEENDESKARAKGTRQKSANSSRTNRKVSAPFWVYKNWIHQRARLHRATCSHCNNGAGTHGTTDSATGEWRPFRSEREAQSFLVATGYKDAKACRVCMANDK